MEWITLLGPIVAPLVDLIRSLVNKPDEEAIKILTDIIGDTQENKTRAAIVLARARALVEFEQGA